MIGQECKIIYGMGWDRLRGPVGVGRIGQEYLQEWEGWVKNVSGSGQVW